MLRAVNETTEMDLAGAITILTEVRKQNFYNWDLTAQAAAWVLDRLEMMEPIAATDHHLQAELLIEESRDAALTGGEDARRAKLLEAQVHATLATSPAAAVLNATNALLDVLDKYQWNTSPDVDDARAALRRALAGHCT